MAMVGAANQSCMTGVSRLKGLKPGSIDYVIVREEYEVLYASRGGGTVLRDRRGDRHLGDDASWH